MARPGRPVFACPACRSLGGRLLYTRGENGVKRRRWACRKRKCKFRFWSEERVIELHPCTIPPGPGGGAAGVRV